MNETAKRVLAANDDLLRSVLDFCETVSRGRKFEVYQDRGIVIVEWGKNSIIMLPTKAQEQLLSLCKKHRVMLNIFCDRGYVVWHFGT